MLTHETYTGPNGGWLFPEEIEKRDGAAFLKGTDVKITVRCDGEDVEVKKECRGTRAIIDTYGADTIRWFMLSDTPPERDVEWTDAGAEGCWRFVQRIHRFATESELPPPGAAIGEVSGVALELRRATHRAIAAVTEDLEALRFNRAVAQIYTLANAIAAANAVDGAARREAVEAIVLLSAPMMPHLAEAAGKNSAIPSWWSNRRGPRPIRRCCIPTRNLPGAGEWKAARDVRDRPRCGQRSG